MTSIMSIMALLVARIGLGLNFSLSVNISA